MSFRQFVAAITCISLWCLSTSEQAGPVKSTTLYRDLTLSSNSEKSSKYPENSGSTSSAGVSSETDSTGNIKQPVSPTSLSQQPTTIPADEGKQVTEGPSSNGLSLWQLLLCVLFVLVFLSVGMYCGSGIFCKKDSKQHDVIV
ncbi:uncharacterized protein [Ptychodera flava]|uniref:uncharacterized protein n=1 Tax=Ptychodera flava TaxID=63121 RepID=UPI00396AA2EA